MTDLSLARRLERTEASANAAFVDARRLVDPQVEAIWHDFAGTYAMFDGVGSPLTQTFGLGLFAAPTDADLSAIEAFFAERGAEVFHEISPCGDPGVPTLLQARGYAPIEQTSVMHRTLALGSLPAAILDGAVTTRRIQDTELDRWAEVSVQGWGASPEHADFMRDFGRVTARSRGVTCFVAEIEGELVGTGVLAIHEGVALLAGASTVPAFRGRGAQTALLAARLTHAVELKCDLAMMGALPGSTSEANAIRQGFQVGYTRTKWHRS